MSFACKLPSANVYEWKCTILNWNGLLLLNSSKGKASGVVDKSEGAGLPRVHTHCCLPQLLAQLGVGPTGAQCKHLAPHAVQLLPHNHCELMRGNASCAAFDPALYNSHRTFPSILTGLLSAVNDLFRFESRRPSASSVAPQRWTPTAVLRSSPAAAWPGHITQIHPDTPTRPQAITSRLFC